MTHRIAPRETAPCHTVEEHYLWRLLLDARKRQHDDPVEPVVDHHYLTEWGRHRFHLLRCYNRQSRFKNWQPHTQESLRRDFNAPVHQEAVDWLDTFIGGYHEILDGQRKLTTEEETTFENHLREIRDCEKQVKFYR